MRCCGDAHQNYIRSVPQNSKALDSPVIASLFLATSISSDRTDGTRHPDEHHALDHNPHMQMINNQRGNHLFEPAPKRCQVAIKVVDQVDAPGGTLSTLGSFAVDPNRPGPQQNDVVQRPHHRTAMLVQWSCTASRKA